MNRQKIAAGPGASSLILIAIVLSLVVLSALTMISARNDDSLSLRSVETAEEAYGLFAQAEVHLAQVDAILKEKRANGGNLDSYLTSVEQALPEGYRLDGEEIIWQETTEGLRVLNCAVRVLPPEEESRYRWTRHMLVTAEEEWMDDGEEDTDE